ncbi:Acetylornithine deacetylase [Pseudomonas fluorescens]|uniref:M20 family metallopeptidase n=1 Tax=Pseudomonas fluorescens TaxID=294 RepID=UPI00124061B7|nr:M20/M25/M40 family metallo-hydrolase [Pseudomonas fluorescens]VVP70124.1 Acetylornithine deacetylase [Pseudomonas fluorescens]
MLGNCEFDDWFAVYKNEMLPELLEYLSIDTSSGKERAAVPYLGYMLEKYGFSFHVEQYHAELGGHRANTGLDENNGKINIRSKFNSLSVTDSTVLFNSHIDVVPAEGEGKKLLSPWIDRNFIYGRGSCDTKGNLFLLFGALAFLKHRQICPQFKILLDLVSEEEVGGNGTLSTILHGVSADLVVVFEPTDLAVHRGHRGCLTCEITVIGKAVHMGSILDGVSAITVAIRLIEGLKILEKEMISEANSDGAFSIWKRPVQINVGKISGGEWPGSVPEKCSFTFNIGFLPTSSIESIETVVKARMESVLSEFPGVKVDFNFNVGLRNKAYLVSEKDVFLKGLDKSVSDARGLTKEDHIFAWRASCDARHYAQEANIPTAIFGAGSLSDAQSADEKIDIDQMGMGIKALAIFLSSPLMDAA